MAEPGILARVRRTLAERRLVTPGQHVLVACSGGPDSVVLTHILAHLRTELDLSLTVASVDHGLRASAQADVALAGALAEKLGLPFHPLRVRVSPGPSLQAQARAARYGALSELAHQIGARRIAVGHTRDDQAETVLLRLLRGSGLRGLRGIAPHRRDGVIRPLLDCSRTQVLAHLAKFGLAAARDPSNEDRRHGRARVRADLLPRLQVEDPRVIEHLAQLADDARDAARAIRARGRRLLRRAASGPQVDMSVLMRSPRAVRREALALWIEGMTGARPSRAQLSALDRSPREGSEVCFPSGFRVRRTGSLLVLQEPGGSP